MEKPEGPFNDVADVYPRRRKSQRRNERAGCRQRLPHRAPQLLPPTNPPPRPRTLKKLFAFAPKNFHHRGARPAIITHFPKKNKGIVAGATEARRAPLQAGLPRFRATAHKNRGRFPGQQPFCAPGVGRRYAIGESPVRTTAANSPPGGRRPENGNTLRRSYRSPSLTQWKNPKDCSTTIGRNLRVGVTKGCPTAPLIYCPDKPVTRAQIASFFVRAINLAPTNTGE